MKMLVLYTMPVYEKETVNNMSFTSIAFRWTKMFDKWKVKIKRNSFI